VKAIADLAQAEMSDLVANAYGGLQLKLGLDYLIPKPFDPRLIERIAPAVAKAAMDSGVACGRSPISMPTARNWLGLSITPALV